MGTKTQKLSNVIDQIVEWQSVVVADGSTGLTAVAGRGYFIDTTSGTITVTLPTSPKAGDIVQLKDYARTWGTNNVILASALMDGNTAQKAFDTQGATVTLVYMDGTKGWTLINEDTTSQLILTPTFIAATGGTVTTSGDYKIHTFTGDGCFVVSTIGNAPLAPLGGPSTVDYLVVAGGGGGGFDYSGGGGAGGYRESHSTPVSGCYTASPLATPTGITLSATTYPITVGGGGATSCGGGTDASNGSDSVFSSITSAGGGGGGAYDPSTAPSGGSGGGGGGDGGPGIPLGNGGSGNTPPVSPPQGQDGGDGRGKAGYGAAGGGGGAGAVGGNATCIAAGPGGNGVTSSINGTPTTRAGGGGGAVVQNPDSSGGTGGTGGGGNGGGGSPGSPTENGTAGTANTGGGGGGGGNGNPVQGAGFSGGKGIVIIRYKFQ